MPAAVLAAARALLESLSGFEAELFSGADCAQVAEALAVAEKACAAARLSAAARAADCGAHLRAGFAEAGDWLARHAGTSPGQARAALETAEALRRCPATSRAFARGELSLSQAAEIARTEAARPGVEAELLARARSQGLGSLREAARKLRLGAFSPQELRRRQLAARSFRSWRDELGMTCFTAALTPEVGVGFLNRLDAEADRLFRAGGQQLRSEPREARAADAFVALLQGKGKARSRSAEVVLVADWGAFVRGHAHPGEVCHIVGGSPVPVALARQMAEGAFVKAVLHDGVEIKTVAHYGRHIPAVLRTALQLGPPPDFEGASCTEPGCGRRYGLEWDHVDPVANQGLTSLANLEPLCKPGHRKKTEADRAAGLLGGRGNRRRSGGKGEGRDPT